MVETLQQFSLTNLSGTLMGLLILWGIWPVACGILGAKRGQAMQGAIHGLFWGPIGLFIVLLSSRKYVCPTCGKKTLTRLHDQPLAAALATPPVLARAVARTPRTQAQSSQQHEPPARSASDGACATPADHHCDYPAPPLRQAPPVICPTTERRRAKPELPVTEPACDEEEAARLRAWVNAD